MSGLLGALNSGKTSLEANQVALEVAGNNIANVNTEGYSRQEVDLNTIPSFSMKGFFIGNGVSADSVQREHDDFMEAQLVSKTAEYGYQNAQTNTLTELERIFPVTDDNISSSISDFFDSVQTLSDDPSDQVARNTLLQKGQELSQKFVSTSEELTSLQSNLNLSINSSVEDINDKLEEIASLNTEIQVIELSGQGANGQRDEQEALIRDLSESIGAKTYTAGNGMAALYLPGGLPLVQGTSAMSFSVENTGTTTDLKLNIDGDQKTLTADSVGGELKGYLEMRDETIPGVLDSLDQLAYHITEEINTQHSAGVDLNGDAGTDFFEEVPNKAYVLNSAEEEWSGAAASMGVSITDSNQIAAGNSSAPGDNENLLAIADLDTKKVDGNDTFTTIIGEITSDIGAKSARQQLSLSSAEDSVTQITNMKESLTGVSLEEEMIDLMKFQRSYQSSAKFLSTVDEMMETLINLR
jgi:flagellar hook-associated protein 1 FlgK